MDYINSKVTIDEIIEDITGVSTSEALDQLFMLGGAHSKTDAIGNFFYGINHRQAPTLVPHNTDKNGYLFFTRPNLNLTVDNIITQRKLNPLLNKDPRSLGRICRLLLDPNLGIHYRLKSPFVDNQNVFIPFLTNSVLSMSNPPSTVLGTYSSPNGVYKESFSMVDDIVMDYSNYDITCTFKNIQGNPFLMLFYSWMLYTSLQFLNEGPVPYNDDIINNRMNYNTRIYRLVMDSNNHYVQHIWAPVYAFPIGLETGSIFGYKHDEPINQALKTLDVQFKCVGNIFNDHLLVEQFNISVSMLQPLMKDTNRKRSMVKLPRHALMIYKDIGYPHINADTYELEWWVTPEQYKSRKQLLDYSTGLKPTVKTNNPLNK